MRGEDLSEEDANDSEVDGKGCTMDKQNSKLLDSIGTGKSSLQNKAERQTILKDQNAEINQESISHLSKILENKQNNLEIVVKLEPNSYKIK